MGENKVILILFHACRHIRSKWADNSAERAGGSVEEPQKRF